MNKKEFLSALEMSLMGCGIGEETRKNLVDFYTEALEDRIESGMSEEAAVADIGKLEDIVKAAVLEQPMSKVVRNKIKSSHESSKKKGHGSLWTVFLILGSPLWIPLMLAFACVVFAIYVTLWALMVAVYAVEFSFAVASIGCFLLAFSMFFKFIPFVTFLGCIGTGLVMGGLTVLLWAPIKYVTKKLLQLMKGTWTGIKKQFV